MHSLVKHRAKDQVRSSMGCQQALSVTFIDGYGLFNEHIETLVQCFYPQNRVVIVWRRDQNGLK